MVDSDEVHAKFKASGKQTVEPQMHGLKLWASARRPAQGTEVP